MESAEVTNSEFPTQALFKLSEHDYSYLVKAFDLVFNSKVQKSLYSQEQKWNEQINNMPNIHNMP